MEHANTYTETLIEQMEGARHLRAGDPPSGSGTPPLMIVGEGTNEIQRNVIAAQLVKRGGSD